MRNLDEHILAFLHALAADAVGSEGFQRRGVRGWRFTDEYTRRFPFAVDHMRVLEPRLLAVREDVLDPGRVSPLYLNRVTQAGEDYLAAREGREPRAIPPAAAAAAAADLETLYLPTDAWAALRVLQPVEDPEEWFSSSRISKRIRRTFYHEEGEFLATRGLVERRRPDTPRRPNDAMLYRATALGRGTRARNTRASSTRVQVRVPGIVLRAPGSRAAHRSAGPLSGG